MNELMNNDNEFKYKACQQLIIFLGEQLIILFCQKKLKFLSL